jgi:hypothetical protein
VTQSTLACHLDDTTPVLSNLDPRSSCCAVSSPVSICSRRFASMVVTGAGTGTLRSEEVEVGSASPIQGAELTANVTAAASSVALDCVF